MKKVIFLLHILTIIVVLVCCSTEAVKEPLVSEILVLSEDNSDEPDNNSDKPEYNILFIGNSLTYYNDLPKLVKNRASEKGITIETKVLAYANYAIVDHWKDGDVQRLIRSQEYDFVIIQQGPSSQQDGYNMLVYDGKKYADLCKENNTKLAYFMVWPSRYYYETFDGVIKNYSDAAKANNAILCPVGKKWKEYFETTNDFSYYGPDQFHPSLKGSQVAAEVIVESLNL